MKFFTVLYNTLFWSLLVSFIMFKNTWIEMRINIGTVLFILWILYFIKNIFKFSIINLIIFAILSLIILKPKGLIYIPSSIIREGLHLTGILNLNVVNTVLIIFIISGILLIYIFRKIFTIYL